MFIKFYERFNYRKRTIVSFWRIDCFRLRGCPALLLRLNWRFLRAVNGCLLCAFKALRLVYGVRDALLMQIRCLALTQGGCCV